MILKPKKYYIFLVFILIFSSCSQSSEASNNKPNTLNNKILAPDTRKSLTNVANLYDEFKKNMKVAENKYKNNTIKTTGVVVYKGPDIHGLPSVELSTAVGEKSYVLCVFNSYKDIENVSIGEILTIAGNFHIFGSNDWVVLKESKIK